MCITEFNPSEPCCDSPLQRCKACPETDWSAFTWLWTQPAAQQSRDLQGSSVLIHGLGGGETKRYFSRYAAVSKRRMRLLESAHCTWFTGFMREATLGQDNAWIPQWGWFGDIVLRDFTFDPNGPLINQYSDGWHSSYGVLERVRESGTEQTANGWGFRVYYVLLFPGNVTAKLHYTLEGGSFLFNRFNCRGSNRFNRDMPRELPSWLTADMFPEWITVSKVQGQGEPLVFDEVAPLIEQE